MAVSSGARIVRVVLAAGCIAALGLCVYQAIVLGRTRPHLISAAAPNAIVSLQLASSRGAALMILDDWAARGTIACALKNLDGDTTLIAGYVALGVLAALFGLASLDRRWRGSRGTALLLALMVASVGAGLFDVAENRQLRALIVGYDPAAATDDCPAAGPSRAGTWTDALAERVATVRVLAQGKFILLLVVWTGLVLIAGAHVVRRRVGGLPSTPEGEDGPRRWIDDLLGAEMAAITQVRPHPEVRPDEPVAHISNGEPWARFHQADTVGLALSGGGIRSATFALGLLQGMSRFPGLLPLIDYLATVSGGGYMGGAWSAWLSRQPAAAPQVSDAGAALFLPRPSGPGDAYTQPDAETAPVRHFREFCNFLVPRAGLLNVETWHAVVALVGAILPSLAAACSVIAIALFVYLFTTVYLSFDLAWLGPAVLGTLAVVVFVTVERWWRHSLPDPADQAEEDSRARQRLVHVIASVVIVAMLVALQFAIPLIYQWRFRGDEFVTYSRGWHLLSRNDAFERWWEIIGVVHLERGLYFSPRLFDFALACIAAGVMLVGVRLLLQIVLRAADRAAIMVAFDRALMRVLALGLVLGVAAAVWHLGVNLRDLTRQLMVAAVASGGAFALLRNWMNTLRKPQSPRVRDRLKPYLPQVLAYLTVILASAAIVSLMQGQLRDQWILWWLAALAAMTIVAVTLLVDPQEFGLHAFYRDRLARAYLGASNPEGGRRQNRQTDARPTDDLPLHALSARPFLLVCCAANDLAGDRLAGLSRGSQSAVLSRAGVAIGHHWGSAGQTSLASALTASAAAFNPNMGSVSVKLGPAVTFLMSALNLRLGLWVKHPASRRDTPLLLPGWLFYQEMFQQTTADGDRSFGDVHLSDGAHFDNLGLYELVRRHCRYVIVSDATADPDVAFDDFGNTARRIREDFGINIEIDLSPLKPNADGCARQHMVVGTIHYDDGVDKGTLLYVKPTLTGDEEPDVQQYRRRNRAFPHETTGDQFYDEAQWESYRRLGDHSARAMLRFVERLPDADLTAKTVFAEARREWYPTTADLVSRILAMTTRLTSIEAELKSSDTVTLVREVFPELDQLGLPRPAVAVTGDVDAANLAWLLRMLQLMEDTWVHCDLDTQWNHPLNLGWMNVFSRWATAPTFQLWWPVLSPMYGSGFLRFMRERFPELDGPARRHSRLHRQRPGEWPAGLAAHWWRDRLGRPVADDAIYYGYHLSVARAAEPGFADVQVGLAAVRVADIDNSRDSHRGGRRAARWLADDFFIPPSLWNAGLGSAFLRKLLDTMQRFPPGGVPLAECRVHVGALETRADPGRRAEHLGYVEFYKAAGFRASAGRSGTASDALELVYLFPVTAPASSPPSSGGTPGA